MASPETSATDLRDRALLLAVELGVDSGAWYLRVLEEERKEGLEPDLGALVRVYWELQRVTGRADLRDIWRSLADQLWSDAQGSGAPGPGNPLARSTGRARRPWCGRSAAASPYRLDLSGGSAPQRAASENVPWPD